MRILIVNDLLVSGGAEMQGLREKKILEENGHEVFYLTFDIKFPENDVKFNEKNGFFNIPINNMDGIKIIKKLILNKKLFKKIIFTIDRIRPDIIHVNNLYLAPITQYRAIAEYKNVIQTIRDYSAVCPKNTCIKKDMTVCRGTKYNECLGVCGENIKGKMKIIKNSYINKIRKKSIFNFICPSEKLTQYCSDHDYDIDCINNPFDFDKLNNFSKKVNFKRKKYLYYGSINEDKGVIPFIEAFEKFKKDKIDVELILAGKIDVKIEEIIRKYIEDEKVTYLGYLKYEHMIEVLQEVYSIVVPSQWMENYPNTVLEAKATGTLVIGSSRGGIPELIKNEKFIFDTNDINDINRVLENTYIVSEDEYFKITNENLIECKATNNIDTYYKKIINKFDSICNTSNIR